MLANPWFVGIAIFIIYKGGLRAFMAVFMAELIMYLLIYPELKKNGFEEDKNDTFMSGFANAAREDNLFVKIAKYASKKTD